MGVLSLAVLALATFVPSASASVVGELSFTNCSGGGVTVTLTTVDWLPVGGGTGCIQTGSKTSVTFAGGTGSITVGELGTVNDLGIGTGNTGFITFPGVTFDAGLIGPGVSNLVCANTFNPNDAACSISSFSPFVLAPGTSGTTITLSVSGLTNDASSSHTSWYGAFTTQIAGQTPLQIENTINTTGAFTATYSFDGQAGVPEPVSMALIGGGLIALAGLRRWKSRL
jgi:hypothetical protein